MSDTSQSDQMSSEESNKSDDKPIGEKVHASANESSSAIVLQPKAQSTNTASGGNANKQPPSRQEYLLEKWLEHQSKELEFRTKALDVDKNTNENNHQFALESLKVQSSVLQREQELGSKHRSQTKLLAGVIAVLLAGLTYYSLKVGRAEFVTKMIETIVPMIASGLGGYGLGYYRGNKKNSSKGDDDDDS